MIGKNISKLQNIVSLDGKIALITGGGTGLGYAIARKFINAGAKVIITGRREDILKKAVQDLGDNADYVVNDIRDYSSLRPLVNRIEKEKGPIEVLVNNAGVNLKKMAIEVTDEEFINIIQTNLVGLFVLTREVSSKMMQRERGSIIMITSMAALYGIPGVTAYSASKSGVLGLTRTLAVDLSPHGIRVNAIAPGFIESPMLLQAMKADPERKQKVLGRTPMKSFGKPDHVANAALYLASDMSKFVTGTNIPIDGGNSIGF